MKTKMKKLLFSFIVLLLSASIFGQNMSDSGSSNIGSVPISLEWQQEVLTERVREKIIQTITPVIKSNDIVVDIDIEIDKNPSGMEIGNQVGKPEKDKKKIRLSDVDDKKLKDDYIVFSKLGLEAPYIDEFVKSEKVSINSPGKSSFNPVKMANQFNVFRYIKNLSAKVYLDEKLTDETRELVSQLVDNLDFNIKSITPVIEVLYISFTPKVNMTTTEKMMDYVQKYNTSFALVAMALILGFMAYLLTSKLESALSKMAGARGGGGGGGGAAAKDSEEEELHKEEKKSERSAKEIHKELMEKQRTSQTGGERFRSFYNEFPKEAINLVRKWIGLENEDTKLALVALTATLSKEELQNIFNNISVEERKKWKKALEEEVSSDALTNGEKFIFAQIIEEIIVPNRISDPEITSAILSLSPETCAKFAIEYPDLATVLMNVLHPQFANQVLEYLDDAVAFEIIEKSSQVDNETLEEYSQEFKEKIQEYGQIADRSPFVDKLFELISVANFTKEGVLFKALKSHIPNEEFLHFCNNFIPSDVILELPVPVLKKILKNLDSEEKIKLIYTAPKGMRKKFIDIVAPEGSKAQQMLEIELEKITNDVELQKQIQDNARQIWTNFFQYGREILRDDQTIKNDLNNEIEKWSSKLAA